jgi:uncharacterized protein YbjT (DUF2867 family)
MKVLVTGAGGFIGRALVDRLVPQGHDVTAVVRHPTVELTRAARIVRVQLGDPLPDGLADGLDLVVHLAHDMAPGSLRRNVEGTTRWFEQAARAGTPHQVYISSYSAHASAPSEYGRAKHELERYVAMQRGTVVRTGLVLGDGGAFGAMAAMVRRFAILPVPGGDLRVFVTTLDDLLTVLTSIDGTLAGDTLNVFGPEPVTLHELLELTRIALGRRGLLVGIPAAVALPMLTVAAPAHAALRRYRDSLAALAASQAYGYPSAYPRLGLAARPVEAMVRDVLDR